MDTSDWHTFRRIVLADPTLQQQLRTIVDWPACVAAVVTAATERGILVTPEDLARAMREGRQSWMERFL